MNYGTDITTTSATRSPSAWGWGLMSPLMAWLLLFVLAPTLILAVYSFLSTDETGQVGSAFSMANYRMAFEPTYLNLYGRSLRYALEATLLCAIIGYPVAWFIGRASASVRSALLLAIMVPFLTSFLIRTYAWTIILDQHGVLNVVLRWLHIIPNLLGENFELLGTPAAVLIALVYTYLPFMILPIYASVEKLDPSLIEASADLGAGPVQSFIRVILPLTMPGVWAGATMVFVPSLAMFAVTSVMSYGKTQLIGDVIERQFSGGSVPFGSALGTLLLGAFIASYYFLSPREQRTH